MDQKTVNNLLDKAEFVFAKTMPTIPHEYTLMKTWDNDRDFIKPILKTFSSNHSPNSFFPPPPTRPAPNFFPPRHLLSPFLRTFAQNLGIWKTTSHQKSWKAKERSTKNPTIANSPTPFSLGWTPNSPCSPATSAPPKRNPSLQHSSSPWATTETP